MAPTRYIYPSKYHQFDTDHKPLLLFGQRNASFLSLHICIYIPLSYIYIYMFSLSISIYFTYLQVHERKHAHREYECVLELLAESLQQRVALSLL